MNNDIQQVQHINPDLSNPVVAATVLGLALIFGACYCTTIVVNAKYNRDTELTYKDLSLKIHSSVPAIAAASI